MEFLSENWLAILFLFIGVGATWVWRGRPEYTKLCYELSSDLIISKGHDEVIKPLEMTYNGIPVTQLLKTKIAIWNGGKKAIDRTFFLKSNPIKIVIDSGYILSFKLSQVTNENNSISLISQLKNESFLPEGNILIDFENLNPSHGCEIEIIHTANVENINLVGDLKNAENGLIELKRKNSSYIFELDTNAGKSSLSYFLISVLLSSLTLAFFWVVLVYLKSIFEGTYNSYVLILMVALLVMPMIFIKFIAMYFSGQILGQNNFRKKLKKTSYNI